MHFVKLTYHLSEQKPVFLHQISCEFLNYCRFASLLNRLEIFVCLSDFMTYSTLGYKVSGKKNKKAARLSYLGSFIIRINREKTACAAVLQQQNNNRFHTIIYQKLRHRNRYFNSKSVFYGTPINF